MQIKRSEKWQEFFFGFERDKKTALKHTIKPFFGLLFLSKDVCFFVLNHDFFFRFWKKLKKNVVSNCLMNNLKDEVTNFLKGENL